MTTLRGTNRNETSRYELLKSSEKKGIEKFLYNLVNFTSPIVEISSKTKRLIAVQNNLAELFISDLNKRTSNILVRKCYPKRLM